MENAQHYQRVDVDYEFDPVISPDAFDLHYNVLYDRYVKKAVAGDESDFNLGGVQLHRAFFEGLRAPRSPNLPQGESAVLIETEFGSFQNFREDFHEACQAVQGSAWVYLSRGGSIKTIPNHKPARDIALIIDLWEHAYMEDYGADRDAYVKNWWRIIDWDVVNVRIG